MLRNSLDTDSYSDLRLDLDPYKDKDGSETFIKGRVRGSGYFCWSESGFKNPDLDFYNPYPDFVDPDPQNFIFFFCCKNPNRKHALLNPDQLFSVCVVCEGRCAVAGVEPPGWACAGQRLRGRDGPALGPHQPVSRIHTRVGGANRSTTRVLSQGRWKSYERNRKMTGFPPLSTCFS